MLTVYEFQSTEVDLRYDAEIYFRAGLWVTKRVSYGTECDRFYRYHTLVADRFKPAAIQTKCAYRAGAARSAPRALMKSLNPRRHRSSYEDFVCVAAISNRHLSFAFCTERNAIAL